VAEAFDIEVSAGSVQRNSGDLRLASLEQHPVGAGGRSARFQGRQHDAGEAASTCPFLHEHPLDLRGSLCHTWHSRLSKSPATHRNGFLREIANEKHSVRRTEVGRGEWRLVRSPVDRDVELLRCRCQRRYVRMLVWHLLQPKRLGHQPSVGSQRQVLSGPETPWQVSRLSQSSL